MPTSDRTDLRDLSARFPRTARAVAEGLGYLHLGAQVYISRASEVLADAAVGDVVPGEPLTPEHLMAWLSAGKPLTAFAVLQQCDAGRLKLDEPVADRLPAFAAHGKNTVTLRHLLTHTAGIAPIATGWPREPWEAILDRICRAKLRHGAIPGAAPAYDPARSWFILGELLQHVTQRAFEETMESELLAPLGLTQCRWRADDTTAPLYTCKSGVCRPQAESSTPDAAPAPGGSFRAPAREVGRFYELLLRRGHWNGRQLLAADAVADMVRPQRVGQFDLTFQHVVDFGLGVIVDSNRYGVETVPYGFGRHCSPRTFGHGGSECAIAFADPDAELVVAVAANGRPGEAAHQRRHRDICSAIYADLGLA